MFFGGLWKNEERMLLKFCGFLKIFPIFWPSKVQQYSKQSRKSTGRGEGLGVEGIGGYWIYIYGECGEKQWKYQSSLGEGIGLVWYESRIKASCYSTSPLRQITDILLALYVFVWGCVLLCVLICDIRNALLAAHIRPGVKSKGAPLLYGLRRGGGDILA